MYRWSSPDETEHLDIGQGEVNWNEFFGTLRTLDFDGVATHRRFSSG